MLWITTFYSYTITILLFTMCYNLANVNISWNTTFTTIVIFGQISTGLIYIYIYTTWSNLPMWHLRGIFVAKLYMTTMSEGDIAVSCVFMHLYTIVGAIFLFGIMTVWLIFGMWQPYLFSDIKYVHSDMGVETWNTCMHIYTHVHTNVYIQACMSDYIHT